MISVYYQNVRGLRTKLDNFKLNLSANDHDLVFITESWLNGGVFDEEFVDVMRYSVFRRDRSTTSNSKGDGGGVFTAVKRELKPTRVNDFESESEDVWVKITFKHIKILLCCVYIPPNNASALL